MSDLLRTLVESATAPDAMNEVNTWLHALAKDTPAKTWWHAEAMHPAIFRALRLDRKEDGAIYAAAPFRLARDPEGRACILCALPAPRIFQPGDDDWLGIETVLAWYPETNEVVAAGDDEPNQIIGPHDASDVFGNPYVFFRAFAEARAQWSVRFFAVADKQWKRRPAEPDLTPGLLLIGDVDKVRWPRTLSAELRCHGIEPAKLNRAILRQANLPRAVSANTMKAAA